MRVTLPRPSLVLARLFAPRGAWVVTQEELDVVAAAVHRKVERRIRTGLFDAAVKDRALRLGWRPRRES